MNEYRRDTAHRLRPHPDSKARAKGDKRPKPLQPARRPPSNHTSPAVMYMILLPRVAGTKTRRGRGRGNVSDWIPRSRRTHGRRRRSSSNGRRAGVPASPERTVRKRRKIRESAMPRDRETGGGGVRRRINAPLTLPGGADTQAASKGWKERVCGLRLSSDSVRPRCSV